MGVLDGVDRKKNQPGKDIVNLIQNSWLFCAKNLLLTVFVTGEGGRFFYVDIFRRMLMKICIIGRIPLRLELHGMKRDFIENTVR